MPANTVLIVDDNPTNLKLVRVVLASEGFDVLTALNAEEAIAAIAQRPPGLILMDIQLPGTDGLQLTRQLKAMPSTRGIIILALTAYAMKGDEERALAAGCDGYIPKPIDTRTMAAVVRRYLGCPEKDATS